MRTISKLLVCLFVGRMFLPVEILAKDEKKSGFVRLANAVAVGNGNLTMEVDGREVNEKGYQLGTVTGGISFASGNHTVRFSRPGTKEGSTRVNVLPDETTILIPFAERVAATDDEPAHWVIMILRLKQNDPEHDRSATFVSVSRIPEIRVEMRDSDGAWRPVFVKRLALTRAIIRHPRGYVPLKASDGDLVSIPVASKGNYVVLLYDDDQGNVRSLNFRDRKFLSAE